MRRALLATALAAWWWANSVFSPWAESLDPRLWLYDVLFYLGFALLAWAVLEVGRVFAQWRVVRKPGSLVWLGALLAGVAIASIYARTDTGLRFKVRASADALARSATLAPKPPDAGPWRFRAIADGWWLAERVISANGSPLSRG